LPSGFGFTRAEAQVLREELHVAGHLLEVDDVARAHQARDHHALADTGGAHGREIERLVELFRLDLDPGFFVLLVQREEALRFLRVLDHVLEGTHGRRGLGRGGGGRARRGRRGRGRERRRGRGLARRGRRRLGEGGEAHAERKRRGGPQDE
jgi:hypothetical protein